MLHDPAPDIPGFANVDRQARISAEGILLRWVKDRVNDIIRIASTMLNQLGTTRNLSLYLRRTHQNLRHSFLSFPSLFARKPSLFPLFP
jgi:hypothetical protein